MTRRVCVSAAILVPLGLSAVLALVPSVASAERIPWSRDWLISATVGGSVLVSGFSGDLERQMRRHGWGQTHPAVTIFGVTFPAVHYPRQSDRGSANSFLVGHSIISNVAIAAGWSSAELGGQTGFDGSEHIEVTSSMSSLAALVLVGDRFRLGGGPTIDWLNPNLGTRSTTGIGFTLQASYRFQHQGSGIFAGLMLAQHLGLPHEIGPYDAGGSSTFPAMKVSPANTTLGLEVGVRLAAE